MVFPYGKLCYVWISNQACILGINLTFHDILPSLYIAGFDFSNFVEGFCMYVDIGYYLLLCFLLMSLFMSFVSFNAFALTALF